mmetsp:Transcript_3634/g.8348  ORF Transcript_3634/g.8348 Transcript_3634/m.8348 type:complete len:247 (-) Transcript_3634:993-1733(-)
MEGALLVSASRPTPKISRLAVASNLRSRRALRLAAVVVVYVVEVSVESPKLLHPAPRAVGRPRVGSVPNLKRPVSSGRSGDVASATCGRDDALCAVGLEAHKDGCAKGLVVGEVGPEGDVCVAGIVCNRSNLKDLSRGPTSCAVVGVSAAKREKEVGDVGVGHSVDGARASEDGDDVYTTGKRCGEGALEEILVECASVRQRLLPGVGVGGVAKDLERHAAVGVDDGARRGCRRDIEAHEGEVCTV